MLNASLINLSSLIQKILDESKRTKENENNDIYSSNSIILNENQNQSDTKNKNIEVNKININIKRNNSNIQLNTSSNQSNNDNNFYSNIHINTLSNIKGLMTNNNYENYIVNAIEKSQSSGNQDDKNSKSYEQSEFIEDKTKNKKKNNKKNSINNKSLNNFEYKKNVYNFTGNKNETAKNFFNKKLKNEMSLKKLKSNKITNSKNRNNSKKNLSPKEYLDNIVTPEESKIKEENKESFINKNNKLYKMGERNTTNNNISEKNNNIRKSYQNLNINNNNNIIIRNRNRSKSNHKKSLTHCGTKSNLGIKNKQNNTTTLNKEELIKQLSSREKSFYILSRSPILRLKERLFFGRSTSNLRMIQSIPELLKNNEILLKNKIKELEKRIVECDKRINSSFNASKMAEINFNFILSKDEEEFKNYGLFADNEKEKKEYYNYLKILFLLFNENYDNIDLKHLNEKLYTCINKKGFKTIKEYLYHLYFTKKEKNNMVYNIDKINVLLGDIQLNDKLNVKFCRFALFTSFLIREIIRYGNDIKNMIDLKVKTKEMINVIISKLELYKAANSFKKK